MWSCSLSARRVVLFCTFAWISSEAVTIVTNEESFYNALQDPLVHDLVLSVNITLNPTFWKSRSIYLTRDVLIRGGPNYPILDMRYIQGKLRLQNQINVTFRSLELQNVMRGLSTTLQFFLRSPDALVVLDDVRRHQVGCLPLEVRRSIMASSPRPSSRPGAQSFLISTRTIQSSYQGKAQSYQEYGVYEDVAILTAMSEDIDDGGYILHYKSSFLLCNEQVDPECLRTRTQVECITDVQRKYLHPQGRAPALSNKVVALIVVITVIALGFLLATCTLLYHLQKSRKQGRKVQEMASGRYHKEDLDEPLGPGPEGVSLGRLLGAGSFGRVYEGVWNKQQVAVKVVVSSGAAVERVNNEALLSMSFTHPNVVRSYFYTTLVRVAGGAMSSSTNTSSTNAITTSEKVATSKNSFMQSMRLIGSFKVNNATDGDMEAPHSSQGTSACQTAPPGPASISTPGPGTANTCWHSFCCLELSQTGFHSALNHVANPPAAGSTTETWIIQEYCSQGSLMQAINNNRLCCRDGSGPDLLLVLLRARDVARGMAYLHAQNVCHGDLKCENVLLVEDPKDPMMCSAKVADFGLSRAITQGRSHLSTQTFGTVTHMSPELLLKGRLGPEGDVYSFGLMLWEMVYGPTPYQGMNPGEVIQQVVVQHFRPSFDPDILPEYRELAEACWRQEPQDRPTFTTILEVLDKMVAQVYDYKRMDYPLGETRRTDTAMMGWI